MAVVARFYLKVDRKGYNKKVTFDQRARAIELHAEEISAMSLRQNMNQQCGQSGGKQVMSRRQWRGSK